VIEANTSTLLFVCSIGAFQILGVRILATNFKLGQNVKSVYLTLIIFSNRGKYTKLSLNNHRHMGSFY